jgi:putative FmdB family regulatory protein
MPIYEYVCPDGHRFEVVQRFSDEPVRVCEVCGKPVQRVLFAPAVHYKGKGFYATDYGRKGANGAKPDSGESGSKEAAASSSDGGSKSESKSSDSKSSDSKSSDSRGSSGESSSSKKSDGSKTPS